MPEGVIKLLPERVANQIAAGEVVQRPASVVKELLENALDAGATKVTLVLEDAGKRLIQVVDNGKGMTPVDARMAFERHATSKIQDAQDLFALHTYGFRGEALASIAAVAEVELKTRYNPPGEEPDAIGTCLTLADGAVLKQEPAACPLGTTLAVRNLFYNVPARRRFLKSNPVETQHILTEFYRAALSNPGVNLVLVQNGEEMLNLAPADLAGRFCQLYPSISPADLLPVDERTDLFRLWGWVAKPKAARRRRGDQYLIVNQRFIRHPYLHHAVLTAYEPLIEKGLHPLYVLYMEVDPARVDVNIHPTKTEVAFDDERTLYALILSMVRKALGSLPAPTSLAPTPGQPGPNPQATTRPPLPQGKPAEQDDATSNPRQLWQDTSQPAQPKGWGNHLGVPKANRRIGDPHAIPRLPGPPSHAYADPLLTDAPQTAYVGRFGGRYLLAQHQGQLWAIHPYRAHERVVYERLLLLAKQQPLPRQRLLFPQTFEVDPHDWAQLKPALPSLRLAGFDLVEVEPGRLLIQAVPLDVDYGTLTDALEACLAALRQTGELPPDSLYETVVRALASRAALPAKSLGQPEAAQRLVDDLLACQTPNTSPRGLPVLVPLVELATLARKLEDAQAVANTQTPPAADDTSTAATGPTHLV